MLVNEQQFIQYARKFIQEYFDMCAEEDNLMIYDHLILPEQTAVVEKFFDNDFILIIVDRDPRDVFFRINIFWIQQNFDMQKCRDREQ